MSMVGRDKEGLWILPELVADVEHCLRDVEVVESDDVVQWLARSPCPVGLELCKTDSMEITLLSVSGGGASCPPRRHPAGTILLYRRLFGAVLLRSVILSGQGMRELKREVLSDAEEAGDGAGGGGVLRRLGGLSRVLESGTQVPSAVLEVALFPPTRSDEGLAGLCAWETTPSPQQQQPQQQQPQQQQPQKQQQGAVLLTVPDPARLFQSREAANAAAAAAAAAAAGVAAGAGAVAAPDGATPAQLSQSLQSEVGGLSTEITTLVRRVLASRRLDRRTRLALGVAHVRGVLLHGPPGCGKTLIAREMARLLNATATTKVVNGPEVFDKYVGVAEQRVRELFQEADEEWAQRGEASRLHVIVLDELDAIGRTRSGGSGDGSSTRDAVVNQLLSKLDGVAQRDNVLVIGATNKKELVDSALLRPGRLEVHVALGLPAREGREEILRIALRNVTDSGLLAADCLGRGLRLGGGGGKGLRRWIDRRLGLGEGQGQQPGLDLAQWLAAQTEGSSGAELVGLVRAAASFAITRALAEDEEDAAGAGGSGAAAAAAGSGAEHAARVRDIRREASAGPAPLRVRVRLADFESALRETGALARGQV